MERSNTGPDLWTFKEIVQMFNFEHDFDMYLYVQKIVKAQKHIHWRTIVDVRNVKTVNFC